MNESDARNVLFIKAIEEGDSAGKIIPKADRLIASRKAEPPELLISEKEVEKRHLGKREEMFIIRRAELLLQTLKNFHSEAVIDLKRVQWKGWFTSLLFIFCFISGFIANEFESGRRLNLLAFPVIGMLVWNFAVYGINAFLRIRGKFTDKPDGILKGPIIFAASYLATRFLKREDKHSIDKDSTLHRCFQNFSNEWLRFSSPIYQSHASRIMHICAMIFAVGIISGMYLRGLEKEYYAGWESTFLEPETVRGFLSIVLGPAALLTGQRVPSVERIEALHLGEGNVGENAAIWIHLFATTTFIFIVVPRCFLAFTEFKREIYLRNNFPIPKVDDPYFRKLLIVKPGQKEHISVVPYTIELTDQQREVLRSLTTQIFGIKSETEFYSTIKYGSQNDFLSGIKSHISATIECLIVIFNLSSIPEDEIHGGFVNDLFDVFNANDTIKQLIVAIDEFNFESRFSHQTNYEKKIESRRELWRRTVTKERIKPIFINLNNPDIEDWQLNVSTAFERLKDDVGSNV